MPHGRQVVRDTNGRDNGSTGPLQWKWVKVGLLRKQSFAHCGRQIMLFQDIE